MSIEANFMEYLEILDKLNDLYYELNYAQLNSNKLHILKEHITDEILKKELIIFTQFQNSVDSISGEINTVKIYGSTIEKTEKELFDYYFTPLKAEDYIEILEDDNDILSSDQDIPF